MIILSPILLAVVLAAEQQAVVPYSSASQTDIQEPLKSGHLQAFLQDPKGKHPQVILVQHVFHTGNLTIKSKDVRLNGKQSANSNDKMDILADAHQTPEAIKKATAADVVKNLVESAKGTPQSEAAPGKPGESGDEALLRVLQSLAPTAKTEESIQAKDSSKPAETIDAQPKESDEAGNIALMNIIKSLRGEKDSPQATEKAKKEEEKNEKMEQVKEEKKFLEKLTDGVKNSAKQVSSYLGEVVSNVKKAVSLTKQEAEGDKVAGSLEDLSKKLTETPADLLTATMTLPMSADDLQKKTEMEPLPWKWQDQCWNDKVSECGSFFSTLQKLLKKSTVEDIKKAKAVFAEKKEETGPIGIHLAKHIFALLENETLDPKNPGHLLAVEMILAMRFSASDKTSITDRTICTNDIKDQEDIAKIGYLGLHRLLAAVLPANLEAEGQTKLLGKLQNQPYSFTVAFSRFEVKYECSDCSNLLKFVISSKDLRQSDSNQYCTMDKKETPKELKLSPLDVGKQKEKVVAIRAMLHVVLGISFDATTKEIQGDSPADIANHLLVAQCKPKASFRFIM